MWRKGCRHLEPHSRIWRPTSCAAGLRGRRRRSSIPAGAAMTWASGRSPLHALSGGLNTRRMLRAPCLLSPAERPPSGDGWLHEIKHDGMRIMARRGSAGVRLITRQGNDFTSRFPLVVAAVTALPVIATIRIGSSSEGCNARNR
jgi:hypothetical protein